LPDYCPEDISNYDVLTLDDIYHWEPTAEGANKPGTGTLESSYKKISSVEGVRTIGLSVRFMF